jgi:tripartite-type tricarboxylate transporter receptor subunit TctC
MRRREFLTSLGAVAALKASMRLGFAQARYPDRPIRLVIPFPPGGAFDAVGRGWADRMKNRLGSVVVENIGGGGSSLGAAAVSRAQPDGYTILLGGAGALVINPLISRTSYDPIRDFAPIASVAVHSFAIAVNPSLPVRTLADLVAHARQNPSKLSYGSAGVGSLNHLTAELLKLRAGALDIVHVPYRGAGPAITDLISGQIGMAVPSMNGQVLELHRSGKLIILAVTSPARLPGAPDIATAVESGVAGMISQNLIGFFAPVGTSAPIIRQVAEATSSLGAEESWRQQLIASGFEPVADPDPDRLRRFIEDEIVRWSQLVADHPGRGLEGRVAAAIHTAAQWGTKTGCPSWRAI